MFALGVILLAYSRLLLVRLKDDWDASIKRKAIDPVVVNTYRSDQSKSNPCPPPKHNNAQDDPSTCVVLLALTTAIFRCDTLVLAVPLLLMLLLRRLMPMGRMVLVGTLSGLGGIGASFSGWCLI